MPEKSLLDFAVVAAIVTTIGSLCGVLLKDFFFARSIERWREKQNARALFVRYREPLIVAAIELASRLDEILKHYPTVYLTTAVSQSRPARQTHNSLEDAYFRRYKLLSTLYRFCALWGWVELYRQDLTSLRSQRDARTIYLETVLESARSAVADGQLNEADDWEDWRDTLVFREELRAIGESMLGVREGSRTVLGYAAFVARIEDEHASELKRWGHVALNFFLDLGAKDFRRKRLELLFASVVQLIQLLDPSQLDARLTSRWMSINRGDSPATPRVRV